MQKIDGLDVRDRSLPPIGYHQAHRVHCFTCRFSFLVFLILRQEIWGVQAQKGLDILCEVLMKPLNAASFAAPIPCQPRRHLAVACLSLSYVVARTKRKSPAEDESKSSSSSESSRLIQIDDQKLAF